MTKKLIYRHIRHIPVLDDEDWPADGGWVVDEDAKSTKLRHVREARLERIYKNLNQQVADMAFKGNKPFVITAAGQAYEADTEKEALSEAERLAHQGQQDVYIFKAIKKVSPKRDVAVTEL